MGINAKMLRLSSSILILRQSAQFHLSIHLWGRHLACLKSVLKKNPLLGEEGGVFKP